MENLGRINLLVGTNNCGKTTVLEAIDILAEYPDPVGLGGLSLRRMSITPSGDASPTSTGAIALRHLFFGHSAQPGTEFVIEGRHGAELQRVQVRLAVAPPSGGFTTPPAPSGLKQLWLVMNKTGVTEPSVSSAVQLTLQAEWPTNDFAQRQQQVGGNLHVAHLQSHGLSRLGTVTLLSEVALNPEEQLVLEVMRSLCPDLQGVTAVNLPRGVGSDTDSQGIYVKLKGQRERVPIGTLGDGLWRLLGLALALVQARGSVLLVDEIEIGLHYTAQVDMWRMVKQAAEELDVQVFATTHSRDCIDALAAIARPDVTTGSEVTIQRIEGERAISYSEREIVLAAERGIEVR